MDADLDPLLASRLAEELSRVLAPAPRLPRARAATAPMRSIIAVVVVVVLAAIGGRELAVLRTPASPTPAARALYFGDPYGSGWMQIDPLTLADRGTKPLLDHKVGPNESVITSADGSTVVVSHYGLLLADHSVYDARTGALRWQFTDQEPMIIDGISANGQEIIGRAGSANHSLTDSKLIVSTNNGHIVRRIPAVDGCCVHAIAYDPSLAAIYYAMGPSFTVDGPGRGPVNLFVQSTTTGTVRTVSLPGIEAGRILNFGSPTVASVPTLYFAATVLSPDGAKFAALSLDGTSLVVVDTATLQVTQKTLIRQTSWRDLFTTLVAYGKEAADNNSWNAAFSADAKTLFAYHTQSVQSAAFGAVTLQTLVLERIDVERGAITAIAPNTRPFTDYISDLIPSSDGQSVYVIQSGRLGIIDRTESPYLRRLDARSLAVQAERKITDNAFDLREFQAPVSPGAATCPVTPITTLHPTNLNFSDPMALVIGGRLAAAPFNFFSPDHYWYLRDSDPRPAIVLRADRLDAYAPPALIAATGYRLGDGFPPDWSRNWYYRTSVVSADPFPSVGCWRIALEDDPQSAIVYDLKLQDRRGAEKPDVRASDPLAPLPLEVDGYRFEVRAIPDEAYTDLAHADTPAHVSAVPGLGLECRFTRVGADVVTAEERWGPAATTQAAIASWPMQTTRSGTHVGGVPEPATLGGWAGETDTVCALRDTDGSHGVRIMAQYVRQSTTTRVLGLALTAWRR